MKDSKIKRIEHLGFPWKTQDPFLFCVHHRDEYPRGDKKMAPVADLTGRNIGQDFTIKDGWRMYHGREIPGFPYHPHRGFETITIAEEGIVDHSDSIGGAGRFSKGDVQWMTAGKGILHSEMFPMLHEDKDNLLEIFQIWLNLPAKDKMVEPHFKMLWNEDISELLHKDNNGNKTTLRVIAGKLQETEAPAPTPNSWAADESNEVGIFLIKMEAEAEFILPETSVDSNRIIYFYEGDELIIEDSIIPSYHSVEVKPDVSVKIRSGKTNSKILVLQGKPINEPVAQHGPFVMNSSAEIQEAFKEYRDTGFGGWPWPKEEQVHDKNLQRFALHSDGRKIEKKFVS